MSSSNLETHFASPEKSSLKELEEQKDIFLGNNIFTELLDSTPDYLIVLNSNRQIVYANKAAKELFMSGDQINLYGLRPGEILNCNHAFEIGSGCGTTEFCRTCGAVKAILSSLKGEEDVQECRIIQAETNEALDLRVWTRPLAIEGQKYSVFTFTDISDEKRRMALERIFFHDVLNTAGGIKSFINLLKSSTKDEIDEYTEIARELADKLVNEIKSQRDLTLAENKELEITLEMCDPAKIINEAVALYKKQKLSEGKNIEIEVENESINFLSDYTLISRVIDNMLKNAIEASVTGDTILIGYKKLNDTVQFFVHNPCCIPEEAQYQIFQRSFSTKGKGRGLGTYSMRLLSERYLKGKIHFESSQEKGTTFYAEYSIRFDK